MRKNSDPWLRFYVRTLNNPKVQRLPSNIFKGWVNLLCLAKETDGMLPTIEDISFRLRLSKSKSEGLINTLKTNGLIDGNKLHDWDDMQYPSDSSTERVKQHRERNKERSGNVPSNVPVTVQSRVEQNRTEQSRTEPPISPSERGTGFSPNGRQRQKRHIPPRQQVQPRPPMDPATEAAYAKRREEHLRTQKANREKLAIPEPASPVPPKMDFKTTKEGIESLRKVLKI